MSTSLPAQDHFATEDLTVTIIATEDLTVTIIATEDLTVTIMENNNTVTVPWLLL
jgi:hypothetical protein